MTNQNFSDSDEIFAKIANIISKKEINKMFPNGSISFAIQLHRSNITAIQLYNSFK